MINLIKDLSNAYGAPGYEDDVLAVIEKHKGNLKSKTDKMMNSYLYYEEKKDDKLTIMLDGHLDEVGFMVQFIDAKGLIKFVPLGGWVIDNIAAQLVMIRNSEGEYIKGVVSSKPPHFMTPAEREKKLSIDMLSIDVGATSREEVINDFKIEVGAPIVPFVDFDYNERNGTMMGKAFDDRLGCAAAIEVMKGLEDTPLDVNLVAALSTQEEVGTRGAVITSNVVKPDLAIVFEGSPADDTFMNKYQTQSALGKGPQFRYRDNNYVAHHKFLSFARDIAKKHNIPYQDAVRATGGTNAGVIHLANQGVPVLVLSIPVRYAHTHHCYSKLSDFQNTVKLGIEIVKNLNNDIYDKF